MRLSALRPSALSALRPSAMRLDVRSKLVLLSLVILLVVSFGFALLQQTFTRRSVEEDLQERAVAFAREIAATIGDERELASGPVLQRQVDQIIAVRQNVLQLDILAFLPREDGGAPSAAARDGDARVVAASHAGVRLPFTHREARQVREGRVVSRLAKDAGGRYWEVIAPIVLDGGVAGAVAAKFSLSRADGLAARTRMWALGVTAVSVAVTALLMSAAVQVVVARPIRRFVAAIRRVQAGDTAASVDVRTRDELGVLARHFNDMMARVRDFSDELQARVKEATHELERRYREVGRLNEQLFATQRSLRRAERLALSGRIMAEVAHEVGTPIHSIAGHLQLLRQDLPAALASPDVRRRLDVIDGQVARVTAIIAQLLDLTRRDPGPAAPVDLNALVSETVELVRPGVAQRQLALEVTADPSLPPVQGQATQLQQVVLNLLTNAVDATPPGGRIAVATRARAGAGEVEVEVSDTGRGIPAAQHREIFEPFFSTKAPGRGTGLGLFISAQIAREHRGRVDVASEEGRGATFRLVLPAA